MALSRIFHLYQATWPTCAELGIPHVSWARLEPQRWEFQCLESSLLTTPMGARYLMAFWANDFFNNWVLLMILQISKSLFWHTYSWLLSAEGSFQKLRYSNNQLTFMYMPLKCVTSAVNFPFASTGQIISISFVIMPYCIHTRWSSCNIRGILLYHAPAAQFTDNRGMITLCDIR